MASRRHIPEDYGGRSAQPPGMMRHGPFPAGHRPVETRSSMLAEHKLADQEAEIERLAGDNHRLAATHVALRQDLVVAQQDIERLRAHIRSTQTEGDIQIRVLLDKIAKMEADIRAGESIKQDLQRAHIEAQSLVADRQELTARIEQATKELDQARTDVKRLPEMHAELDSLRQEHQKLRTTFEYEKGLNMGKVEQMQVMEKDLVGMAREVENLRSMVLNAEKKARAPNPYPYGGPYMNPDPMYPPPPMQGGGVGSVGGYTDPYGSSNAGGSSGWAPHALR